MKLLASALIAPTILAAPPVDGENSSHTLLPPVENPEPIVNPTAAEEIARVVDDGKHGPYGYYDLNGIWHEGNKEDGWWNERNEWISNRNDGKYIDGKWVYSRRPLTAPRPIYRPQPVIVQEPKNYWWNTRPVETKPIVNSWFWNREPVEVVPVVEKPVEKPIETYVHYTPPVAPVVQQTQFDPWMMMMLLGDDNDSKMSDLLIPLLMSQGQANGNAMDMMSNPLMMMALLDDTTETCATKYATYDTTVKQSDANPTVTDNSAAMTATDFLKIDMAYIGCLEHEKANAKNDDNDLLLPLMMQMLGGNGGQQMDPIMLMLLTKDNSAFGGSFKKFLPFLASSGFTSSNMGQMDPMTMMLFLEEAACEIKFDIPTFYYTNDVAANTFNIVTDKALVKTFYENLYPKYKTCSTAAGSDDKNDFLFWMMMMNMPMNA